MMRNALATVLLLLAALAPGAPRAAPPGDVPDTLRPPAGERVVLEAHATGVQIYQCTAADGGYQWTLLAPDAQLRDAHGALVAHHGAGPTWKHVDGSEITGKLVAKAPAPDADAIPWLLLSVSAHSGAGVLEHVTSVQRLHTRGGQPPPAAECSAGNSAAKASVPYQADYRFFAPGT
jgi:hypothetical protein